jgi:spore maturation protein SpmA
MSAGAVVWARSDEFLVVGTVCLFLIPFAIIGFGTYYSSGKGMIFVLILFG